MLEIDVVNWDELVAMKTVVSIEVIGIVKLEVKKLVSVSVVPAIEVSVFDMLEDGIKVIDAVKTLAVVVNNVL